LMKAWHKNGNKKNEINYQEGAKNGLSTEWYENGTKKLEAQFKMTS